MTGYKAKPDCWEWQEEWASQEAPDEISSCILELRARVEALEAQVRNYPEIPDSSIPPPVATDKELRAIWDNEYDFEQALHSIYNLGVAHGQARSRKVAKPAPVAGGLVERVSDAIIIFNALLTEEVIRLDKEGFHYKGQFIADAGEVHRLMLAFLKQHANAEQEPPTDEEIEEWADAATEVPLEEIDPEIHGWRRCFAAKEFSETIRAAIERWGK